MKVKNLILVAAIICVCCSSCKDEKLAIAGCGWNEIAIVDKVTGTIEWKQELESGDECNDIEVTPKGDVLYAYQRGARLINRKHETIWDFKAKENEEIHTATRLKDGGFMIAVCGEPARIVELDKDGKQVKEIPFHTVTFDVHKQFRQVTKTDDGIYIVPLIEKQKIIRITQDGKNRGSIYASCDLFSTKVLKNGNWLVSCGDAHIFTELNPQTRKFEHTTFTDSIKGASLLYVAEIVPYKNGNLLIANSNMMSDDKSQPLLFEINKEDEVIWSLPFNNEIKNITAVYPFKE